MPLKTKQNVVDSVKRIIKRGARYDTDIDENVYLAVRDLEMNFDFQHMHQDVQVNLGAQVATPRAIYGMRITRDVRTNAPQLGPYGSDFNEDPNNIKRITQVAIIGNADAPWLILPSTFGANGSRLAPSAQGANNKIVYPLSQVKFEDIQQIYGDEMPAPALWDGTVAPFQMPTQFCITKHGFVDSIEPPRQEVYVNSPAKTELYSVPADTSFLLFNGPLFNGVDVDIHLTISYKRYTPDSGETQSHAPSRNTSGDYAERMAVYSVAYDFLIAATMVRMSPIIRQPDILPLWEQREAKARRILGISEEEKEFAAESDLEMGYYPEL